MKKISYLILVLIAVNVSSKLFSQDVITMKWNQSDGQDLFYDCKDYLTQTGKTIKEETVEKICFCYKEEIEKKYKREEYKKLSTDEMKSVKETTISSCAKNNGVKLNTEKAEPAKVSPKK